MKFNGVEGYLLVNLFHMGFIVSHINPCILSFVLPKITRGSSVDKRICPASVFELKYLSNEPYAKKENTNTKILFFTQMSALCVQILLMKNCMP
jgi:hypothetical protein